MEAAFSLPFARASASDAKQNGVLYCESCGPLRHKEPARQSTAEAFILFTTSLDASQRGRLHEYGGASEGRCLQTSPTPRAPARQTHTPFRWSQSKGLPVRRRCPTKSTPTSIHTYRTNCHRSVRNDTVPRPLTKGLLDGTLLSKYSMLSTVKQQQLADRELTFSCRLVTDNGGEDEGCDTD